MILTYSAGSRYHAAHGPAIQAVEYSHLQVSRLLLAEPDKGSFVNLRNRGIEVASSIRQRSAASSRSASGRTKGGPGADVFDLGAVLIPRTGGETSLLEPDRSTVETAVERALSLSYADYKSQVVSYLHPDYRESMGSPKAWDAFRSKVVEYLEDALSKRRGSER